uniref:Uncharacterized protein n=1 Tax=Rhipicephalus zambeziensis TaxID=60191 RepID=A0A224Y6L6_9ACAR
MALEHRNQRQISALSFAYWMLPHGFSYHILITTSTVICSQFLPSPTENVPNSKPQMFLANLTSMSQLNIGPMGRVVRCMNDKIWCLCPSFIIAFLFCFVFFKTAHR